MLLFHLALLVVDDNDRVLIWSLFFRTMIFGSFTGVTSQDRLSYAVVINNPKIPGVLRNIWLFLIVKKK